MGIARCEEAFILVNPCIDVWGKIEAIDDSNQAESYPVENWHLGKPMELLLRF
jgi:hypothetical protein